MKRIKYVFIFISFLALAAVNGMAKDPGTLVVLNKTDNTAMIFDLKTNKMVSTLPTGVGPHEAVVSADGNIAVVANYGAKEPGSTLTLIDLLTHKVTGTISLGEYLRPHGLVFLPGSNNKLLVTSERAKKLLLLDLGKKGPDKIVKTFPTEQSVSHMVAVTPDGKTAIVSSIGSGSATIIHLESDKPVKVIPTGKGAEAIDVSPDGKQVWVGNRASDSVSVIDIASGEVVKTITCEKFPIRLKFTPDGKDVLVSAAMSSELVFYDPKSYKEVYRMPFKVSVAGDSKDRLFGDQAKNSPMPVGILIHPSGKWAYVAATNADQVAIVDIKKRKLVKWIKTGKQPDGLGFSYKSKGIR
ncbi:MAG: beta-propeller fold lactonase family protein [bacterium]|nr:beta-propeller fold lactonase family protein [bacterium]